MTNKNLTPDGQHFVRGTILHNVSFFCHDKVKLLIVLLQVVRQSDGGFRILLTTWIVLDIIKSAR